MVAVPDHGGGILQRAPAGKHRRGFEMRRVPSRPAVLRSTRSWRASFDAGRAHRADRPSRPANARAANPRAPPERGSLSAPPPVRLRGATVQPRANLRHRRRVGGRQREVGPYRASAGDEKLHRRDLSEFRQGRQAGWGRPIRAARPASLLAGDMQGAPAGCEHDEPRTGRKQRDDERAERGRLAVVEHQQHLARVAARRGARPRRPGPLCW